MLSWARQLPIGGEPANIVKILSDYDEWLSQSRIPKLFIEANPGTLSEKEKVFCNSLLSQTHIVLRGSHNLQEDVADEIGIAISVWLQGITGDSSSSRGCRIPICWWTRLRWLWQDPATKKGEIKMVGSINNVLLHYYIEWRFSRFLIFPSLFFRMIKNVLFVLFSQFLKIKMCLVFLRTQHDLQSFDRIHPEL